jgi:hypothetical protein
MGAVAYLAVPVLFAIAVIKTPRSPPAGCGSPSWRWARRSSCRLFDDPIPATMGYALAPGLQYVVFMGIVSVRRKAPIASLVTLLGLSVPGAVLLNAAVTVPDIADLPYGLAIYGVFVGS